MGRGGYGSHPRQFGWEGSGPNHHNQFERMNGSHHQNQFERMNGSNHKHYGRGFSQQFSSRGNNMGPNSRGNQSQRGGGRGGHLNKPWITPQIRNEIYHRNSLSQKAKQSKASPDFDALNDQKMKVNEMIEEAKRKYFSQNPGAEDEWLHILARESFSNSTWCDVCDKGFDSIRQLREHESEHVTCDVDGCKYTGHQSVMEKHIQHQHISGLFHRIPQGKSKEEIEKWRAERRKNFPTSDKVAQKDAERAEFQARGEVMRLEKIIKKYTGVEDEVEVDKNVNNRNVEPDWECTCKARFLLKNSKKRIDIRRLKHQGHCQELVKIRERFAERKKEKMLQMAKRRLEKAEKKEKSDGIKVMSQVVQSNTDNVEDSDSETEGMNGTLPMFAGLGKSFLNNTANYDASAKDWSQRSGHDFEISDDEFEVHNDAHYSDITHHDESLIGSSKLDDCTDSKDDVGHNIENGSEDQNNEKEDQNHENESEDDDGPPEEIKTQKSEVTDITEINESHLDKSEDVKTNEVLKAIPGDNFRRKRKQKDDTNEKASKSSAHKIAKTVFSKRIGAPTLLEKLLHDEIKHERNLILQCVRYVCNNKFLQDQQM